MVTTLRGCTTRELASPLQLGYRSFTAASRPALGHNLDSCLTGSKCSSPKVQLASNLLPEILGRLEVYLLRRLSLQCQYFIANCSYECPQFNPSMQALVASTDLQFFTSTGLSIQHQPVQQFTMPSCEQFHRYCNVFASHVKTKPGAFCPYISKFYISKLLCLLTLAKSKSFFSKHKVFTKGVYTFRNVHFGTTVRTYDMYLV